MAGKAVQEIRAETGTRMETNRHGILITYVLIHLFSFVLFSQKIYPQISFETFMENYYDDNIYNNSYKIDDFVNSFSLNSGYNFESEFNNLQFYYMGNISYYQKNIFKTSNSHKVGAVNTYLFSQDDNPINIGINYTWRNNREDFIVFDFDQLSAYANYRQCVAGNNYILFGYVFNKNNYKNFSVFSHYEHKSFITGIISFETETTLTLGLKYNIKKYIDNIPGTASTGTQLGLSANISQSIDDYTGINSYTAFRKNLTSGTRYINSDDFIFYEEEIFNDLYSNDGYDLGISLTRYLSGTILAKADFIYAKKNFSNIPVPDAEGYDTDILRKDEQIAGALGIEFYLNNLVRGLSLELNWNYIHNNSNDLFYNYDNNLLSVGLNLGL
jgi:hypothetical protein